MKYAAWVGLNRIRTEMFYFIIARLIMSVKGLSVRSYCCRLFL